MGSSTTSEYRSEQYEMTLSRAMYAPANDRRQQPVRHRMNTIRYVPGAAVELTPFMSAAPTNGAVPPNSARAVL